MSLVVWLPLTKDLRQQGLANTSSLSLASGNSLINGGKVGGQCLALTKLQTILENSSCMSNKKQISYAYWIKVNTAWSANWLDGIRWTSSNGTTNSVTRQEFYTNCTKVGIWFPSSSTNSISGKDFTPEVWTHLAATFDYSTGDVNFYINGVLQGHVTTLDTTYYCRGDFYIGDNGVDVSMNDVRIYDHCLSPMEVKELAKGLVLHYPLNRQGLGPSNLIKNGFGELGTENWTNSSNISTTDIPSDQPDIKISVTNNYTVERIKIYPTHTYKFSAWIKATTTSGNTYPSLFPYDIDGKFIDYQKCSDGFNLNTMTTLKQQLKTGDTKIYVNDLSQWNENSGHYYNWAAIFSYTDSTGYTYPDGTYTQNLGRFGTSANAKTNLDKTNNIITLTTAYTGPNMPIGTKICASTEGSTYYYPLGGINLANIQNWTYKEGTFSASTARLKYAKEVMFWTYTNNRMAGIKLQDLINESLNGTIEYDCSGLCNNGSKMTNTITYTSDTAKYAVSTHFNGTYDGIIIENLILKDMINSTITYAFWIKPESESGARSIYFGSYSGISWSIEKTAGNQLRLYWNGSPDETCSGTTITDGVWQHICITKNGTNDVKVYINGVQKWTSTATHSNLNFPTTYRIGRDTRSNDGTPYKGLMSDFRIYATALSADDVKSLYQNCATIDPDGTIRGQIRN